MEEQYWPPNPYATTVAAPGSWRMVGGGLADRSTRSLRLLLPPLLAAPVLRHLRLAALRCILAGRSLRNAAAWLGRQLLLAAGWFLGPLQHRRLIAFRRAWFPLRRWHVIAGAVLGVKSLQGGWRLLRWLAATPPRRRLEARLRSATSYSEWVEVQRELAAAGCSCKAELPDSRALEARGAWLRGLRARGDVAGLIHVLRVDLARHHAHVKDGDGDDPCPLELLAPLQGFIEEVKQALAFVEASPEVTCDEKLTFLRELRHAFGRTGLLLSGGGSFGIFHFGVFKALLQAGVLPRVVSGSSAGAIAASMICTQTDEELREAARLFPDAWSHRFFAHDTQLRQAKHLLLKGTLQDHEVFHAVLCNIFGDITFEEAYQRTGRILNISVTPFDTREPHRLLNYLTAPNLLVRSAVAASSAFPWLFQPTDLLAKTASGQVVRFTPEGCTQMRRWCDGSIQADLPMQGLREMFNVNFFVVSQCNPYLLPLVGFKRWLPRTLAVLWETEFKHRCRQLLRFFPSSHTLSLLSQNWEGDVSMVLPYNTFPFKRASVNLNPQELRRAAQEGMLTTWAKLSAIQSSTAIEVAIDDSLQRVSSEAAARQLAAKVGAAGAVGRVVRRSLPSWLHMPALGLPMLASRDTSQADLAQEEREGGAHALAAATPPAADAEVRQQGAALLLEAAEAAGRGDAGAEAGAEAGPAAAAHSMERLYSGELVALGLVAAGGGHGHGSGMHGGGGRGGAAGAWMDLVLLGSAAAGGHALDVVAP